MSEKLYTDEELCQATQVAYCNIKEETINQYRVEHNGEYPSLQEIFLKYGYDIYYDQDLITGEKRDKGEDLIVMEESAKKFIDAVIAGEICQGWKVVSVHEEQLTNGFYGMTIETGEGNAIVAFRGSESWCGTQIVKDWIVADGGIINFI